MGSSTKKTNTNTTTNQATNSASNFTTTPNVADFAVSPVQNYFSALGDFGSNFKPDMLATPANGLQQHTYTNAHFLPTGDSELGQSSFFARQAGNAAPATYKAPTIAPTATGSAASLLDGLDSYFNPYEDRVIDTTLADMDVDSDRTRGDFLAAGARNRGLSGSRFGIGQGALEGELSRARASTDANLRSSGFDRATTLSNQDAGRRQDVTMAQMAAENARALAQAGFDAQGGMFNVDTGQRQADRMLSAGGLLSNNAQTGSAIANNNLTSQMAAGNGLWDIDRYNNAAPIAGMQGFGGLADPSLYSEFTGQNVTGYENGTMYGTGTENGTVKSSGGLLGGLGGLLSLAPGIGGLFKK